MSQSREKPCWLQLGFAANPCSASYKRMRKAEKPLKPLGVRATVGAALYARL